MNPDRMRSDYGKLMYLLMDASEPAIQVAHPVQSRAMPDVDCPVHWVSAWCPCLLGLRTKSRSNAKHAASVACWSMGMPQPP